MGLHLSAADIAALEDRTEGWIAGLQLAALSLQGSPGCSPDSSGHSRETTATSRTIWSKRSCSGSREGVRRFLLQTAILERLHGPLCDAVTGQEEGAAQLEALERGNFFVVPLDDTAPLVSLSPPLCRRALLRICWRSSPIRSRRCIGARASGTSRHGSAVDAIRHALAAADCRACGGPGRAGHPGHAPESTGSHGA